MSFCRFSSEYKTFENIYTRKADRFVGLFLDSDHTLSRYKTEIDKYKAIAVAVASRLVSVALGLFLVDTKPLCEVMFSVICRSICMSKLARHNQLLCGNEFEPYQITVAYDHAISMILCLLLVYFVCWCVGMYLVK